MSDNILNSDEDFDVDSSYFIEEEVVKERGSGEGVDVREIVKIVLSRVASEEDYEKVMILLSSLSDLNLLGEIPKIVKNRDEYWTESREMAQMGEEERNAKMHSYLHPAASTYELTKYKLWRKGSGVLTLGNDPAAYVSKLRNMMPDIDISFDDSYADSAVIKRLKSVEKVMNGILKCASNYAPERTSLSEKADKVLEMFQDICAGSFKGSLKIKEYKATKELGLLALHTLPTKEWLGVTIAELVSTLWGGAYRVGFHNAEIRSKRILTESSSSYFTFDTNEEGSIMVNEPSIFEVHNPLGDWDWRVSCDTLKEEVKLILAEGPKLDRDIVLADIIKGKSSARFEILDRAGCIVTIRELSTEEEDTPRTMSFLQFFKMGISSKQEVTSNAGYLHVVTNSVAKLFRGSTYHQVALPDCVSVVLFPSKLWEESSYIKDIKKRGKGIFASRYGCDNSVIDFKPYAYFLQLSQLYQLAVMLRAIRTKQALDEKHYFATARQLFSQKSHVIDILSGGNVKDFVAVVKVTAALVGLPMGLSLHPECTKEGEKMHKESLQQDENAQQNEWADQVFGQAGNLFDETL